MGFGPSFPRIQGGGGNIIPPSSFILLKPLSVIADKKSGN